jgi:hypothetical protein
MVWWPCDAKRNRRSDTTLPLVIARSVLPFDQNSAAADPAGKPSQNVCRRSTFDQPDPLSTAVLMGGTLQKVYKW